MKIPSHLDIKQYRTSSKIVKPIFDEFDSIIIAEFFNPQDALSYEQELIFEHWDNPLLLNQSCHVNHTSHWSTTGKTFSADHKAKLSAKAATRMWSDEHKAKISATQKGKSKPCRRVDKFSWYNNGSENKLFSEHDIIPENFTKGRLMPRNKNNTNNKGKSWFYDGTKRVYQTK